ncbi:MAG: hypothetical protein PSX42_15790, partial [bacterium]|nr:hypothetical protein [bacterium]
MKEYIEIFSNIAQVVIAIANLYFAYYIITYQRNKDSQDKRNNEIQHLRISRLEWFRILIINP